MKHGKYEKIPPAAPRKKKLTLVICLVLLLAVGVGTTLAYFHLASGPVINTFQAGSAGAKVDETRSGNVKEAIYVTNTGKSPVYVRVRLVSYYEISDGVVDGTQASPTLLFTAGDKWVPIGNYYYYNAPLAAGATTESLLKTAITMEAGQVIEVLTDTVQANPAQAVKDVWGVESSQFIAN